MKDVFVQYFTILKLDTFTFLFVLFIYFLCEYYIQMYVHYYRDWINGSPPTLIVFRCFFSFVLFSSLLLSFELKLNNHFISSNVKKKRHHHLLFKHAHENALSSVTLRYPKLLSLFFSSHFNFIVIFFLIKFSLFFSLISNYSTKYTKFQKKPIQVQYVHNVLF